MSIFKSIIAAISTFSRIPTLSVRLDEKDFRYTMCFFPLVGVIIALLEWAAYVVCLRAGAGELTRTCIMCALPIIVTGGIHLDGFCDTSDAKSSYKSKEEKLKILKDPHIGAFGVIRLTALTLLYAAAVSGVKNMSLFGLTFVISRAVTAFSVVMLKSAKDTGMGAAEKNSSDRRAVYLSSLVWLALCAALSYATSDFHGAAVFVVMLVLCAILFLLYRRDIYSHFGGFTGDTSGFFLCVTEVVLTYVCMISDNIFNLIA